MVGNQVKGHLGMDCIGLRTHGGRTFFDRYLGQSGSRIQRTLQMLATLEGRSMDMLMAYVVEKEEALERKTTGSPSKLLCHDKQILRWRRWLLDVKHHFEQQQKQVGRTLQV
ncbi:hypothetical protein D5086_022440 [Populus alba]|uniref:Uncharacterized protein n=1 Tax=Populus alba TaxID=43335 RepID=A0ACC4BFR4_POPAL